MFSTLGYEWRSVRDCLDKDAQSAALAVIPSEAFVIPSEARNLLFTNGVKSRFLATLGMTKSCARDDSVVMLGLTIS